MNRSNERLVLGVAWATAWVFSLWSYSLTNDQFDRISRARQIARYGELPFRDFLDPGYLAAEYVLAALQRLLGDNLLADWLLTAVVMASGAVVVMQLARRVSGSWLLALTAAAVLLLSFPRAYEYDKVLFYPLGILLCCRYVERGRSRELWGVAACVVIGALFRYDTGVYLGGAALTTILVRQSGHWRVAARHGAALGVAVFGLALPCILLLGYTAGLSTVVDQVTTYGRREYARTRIDTTPTFALATLVDIPSRRPPSRISVRWTASIDEARRLEIESAYQLRNAVPHEENVRTWSYAVADDSEANIRALVRDPAVEDTSGIDRLGAVLDSSPLLRIDRSGWHVSLRGWNGTRANAFLYHLLHWLPVVAAVILVLRCLSASPPSPAETATISGLIVLALLLNLFILRNPIAARVGGIAGPTAVIGAWLVSQVSRLRAPMIRLLTRFVAATIFALTLGSLAVATEWNKQPVPRLAGAGSLQARAALFSGSSPALSQLPKAELGGLVGYLRECTAAADRVFATWFVPELYFFAQRGFAAGLPTIFSDHWSEDRFQARSIRIWETQSVPMVVTDTSVAFNSTHPMLARYIDDHYLLAGTTNFMPGTESAPRYSVFVRRGLVPRSIHPQSSLPCF